MNIQNYFSQLDLEEDPKNTRMTWDRVIKTRKATFTGFAELETNRGFIRPCASINSSQGQEMCRILFFRAIEEVCESIESWEDDHRKEELIDAFNYILSASMLDPNLFPENELHDLLVDGFATVFPEMFNSKINMTALGMISYRLAKEIPEHFRNRAWMNQAQDLYFAGKADMRKALVDVLAHIFRGFENLHDFLKFYLAKDCVLQFRLRSHY